MQSPIVIFDHVKKTVTTLQQGPIYDKKTQEVLAQQRAQVTSSGSSPAR